MANLSNINNVLRVSSNLRVGINTDAASYALEIGGSNSGIKLKNSGASGKVYSILSDTSGNFQIYDDAAASGRLVINSAGNATFVGTVTTPQINLNSAGGGIIDNQTANIFIQTPASGGWIFRNGAPGYAEKMRIDSSGLVKFSKTATTATAVASINHASNDFLYINGGTAGASFGDDNQSTRVICYNNDYIRFDSAAVERMRLTPDGNNTFLIIKAKPATYNSKSFITLYGTNSSTYGGSVIARSSISSETDGSAYGANLKFYTNDSSNVEQTRLQISSNGFGYFYNNFYLASAANQGNLFFGTADDQYNIFGGGTYGYMGYNTSGYHRFLASGTERMRITSVGDILCTSDGGSDAFRVFNPGTGAGDIYLRVEKAYTSAAVGRAAGIILGSNAGNLGSTWTMEATSQLGYFGGADLAFTHNNGGTASRRVTFKNDGDVGIGTDSPNGKLTILENNSASKGDFDFQQIIYNGGWSQNSFGLAAIQWSDGTGSSNTVGRIGVTYTGSQGQFQIKDLYYNGYAGSGVVFTARGDGNVGIGTASPNQKLEVVGIVKHQGLDMTAGVQVDQITSYTKTLTGTANTWRPTGIDYNDIGNSGSYLVQVFNDDHSGAGPSNYSWFWTGTMSWYYGLTNNATTSEIYLNGCGHHTNIVFELRTKVNYNNAANPYAELEWKSATSFVDSPNWIFKFRRLM